MTQRSLGFSLPRWRGLCNLLVGFSIRRYTYIFALVMNSIFVSSSLYTDRTKITHVQDFITVFYLTITILELLLCILIILKTSSNVFLYVESYIFYFYYKNRRNFKRYTYFTSYNQRKMLSISLLPNTFNRLMPFNFVI